MGEQDKYKAITEELEATFAEMSGYQNITEYVDAEHDTTERNI